MLLLPIDIDETKNLKFRKHPECIEVLNVYPGFYERVGYNLPWIGYFASPDGEEVVGMGGFKGKPKDQTVEIAYGTLKTSRGQGIGTEICRQLVLLALKTDSSLRITARTLQDGQQSMRILQKNGFECLGIVNDPEDGDVFEWEFKNMDLFDKMK